MLRTKLIKFPTGTKILTNLAFTVLCLKHYSMPYCSILVQLFSLIEETFTFLTSKIQAQRCVWPLTHNGSYLDAQWIFTKALTGFNRHFWELTFHILNSVFMDPRFSINVGTGEMALTSMYWFLHKSSDTRIRLVKTSAVRDQSLF